MVMPTIGFLGRVLQENAESPLLLCGTATTAGSRIYEKRLAACGVRGGRIFSLGCPGLATQIEYAPSGATVRTMIRRYVREAEKLFPVPPEKLLIALCCTHFGYSPLWAKEFSVRFGNVEIFNPNRAAVEALLPRWRGNFRPDFSVRFLTRVDFPEIKAQALAPCFSGRAPEIIGALFHPERDIGLFDF